MSTYHSSSSFALTNQANSHKIFRKKKKKKNKILCDVSRVHHFSVHQTSAGEKNLFFLRTFKFRSSHTLTFFFPFDFFQIHIFCLFDILFWESARRIFFSVWRRRRRRRSRRVEKKRLTLFSPPLSLSLNRVAPFHRPVSV